MKRFEGHTNAQHRLFEWLALDVANFFAGQEAGNRVNKAQHEYAREVLKKEYIQYREFKPDKESMQHFMDLIDDSRLSADEKLDIKLAYIQSIQNMLVNKKQTFSTSPRLMSKDGMRDFINFVISKMKSEGIPFRKEVANLMKKQEYESWVWLCLQYRICEICNRQGDLHHVDHVGSFGRKNDDGRGKRVTCLCREHHSEIHADYKAYDKYGVKGIYLRDDQIRILKTKYVAQFRAFKEEEDEEL